MITSQTVDDLFVLGLKSFCELIYDVGMDIGFKLCKFLFVL